MTHPPAPAPLPREEIERIDAVYARWKAATDSGVIPLEEMRARRCLNVALRYAWPSIKAEIEASRAGAERVQEWRCFFCDEMFTTPEAAREHFGADQFADAACRLKAEDGGLVAALRKAEDDLQAYRTETDPESTAYYAQQDEHRRALIREEQKGYDRGLADGRAELAAPRQAAQPADGARLTDPSAGEQAERIIDMWVRPDARSIALHNAIRDAIISASQTGAGDGQKNNE